MTYRYLWLPAFTALLCAAMVLGTAGCGRAPTTVEQAAECRHACAATGMRLLRFEEKGAIYTDGTPVWRCVCGAPR